MRLLILVLFFILCGCGKSQQAESNRYEMSKDATGRTVRLDKQTGEIAVIGEDRITVLKGQAEQELEAQAAKSIETPKFWPSFDLSTNTKLTATLATTWRNGKLAYQFSISPMSPLLNEAKSDIYNYYFFKLILSDIGGFKIKEILLPIRPLTTSVDKDGVVIGLYANDSVELSSNDYSKITIWSVEWSLPPDVKPPQEAKQPTDSKIPD